MPGLSELTNQRSSGSILLKLDVRDKMIMSVLVAFTALAISNAYILIALFLITFIYALLMRRPKVLIVSYIMMLIVMLMSYFFVSIAKTFMPSLKDSMTLSSLAIPFLRSAVAMNAVVPMAFTIRIQNMLSALQSFKLPFIIYIPATVMVRFIPSFTNDVKQIFEAMKLRGFEISFKNIIKHPFLITRLCFLPLVYMSLRTSDDLGIAAELKGVGYTKHVPYHTDKMKSYDYVFIISVLGLCIGALLLQYILGETKIMGMHR